MAHEEETVDIWKIGPGPGLDPGLFSERAVMVPTIAYAAGEGAEDRCEQNKFETSHKKYLEPWKWNTALGYRDRAVLTMVIDSNSLLTEPNALAAVISGQIKISPANRRGCVRR
jgi:hypothetical protein